MRVGKSDGFALPSSAVEVDDTTEQEGEVVDDVGNEAQVHRQTQADDGDIYIYGIDDEGEHL